MGCLNESGSPVFHYFPINPTRLAVTASSPRGCAPAGRSGHLAGTRGMAVIPWMDVLLIQALAALLVWAAISDLRRFVIPNRVSLSIALLYPAYVLSAPQPVDW